MKKIILLCFGLVLAFGELTARAQNPCVEHGPYYGAWECVQQGSVNNHGSLNITNIVVCAGDTITAPTLSTAVTFNAGQKRRAVTYDCSPGHYETNTVPYTAGSLYFVPSIPGSIATAGVYTYTGKVDGTPTGGVCASITNTVATVTVTVLSMITDSDYDGVCDCQELRDGTDRNNPDSVNPVRLGYWQFSNTNTWIGEQGQLPKAVTNLSAALSWSNNAVLVSNTNGANLKYRDAETNSCLANINCRKGSLRFWFQPTWNSTNNGGSGPGSEGRLIEMGAYTSNASYGQWGLLLDATGTNINFISQTNNGLGATNLTASISWQSNEWHQLVLTYTPTNSLLYIDGQLATNGSGVTNFPNATVRVADGFSIGSDRNGNLQAKGAFDELETFNYPLSSSVIATNYQTIISRDSDGDGMPDVWESQYGLNPLVNDAKGDPDGDGWTNLEEYQNGTNPNVVDEPLKVVITRPRNENILP